MIILTIKILIMIIIFVIIKVVRGDVKKVVVDAHYKVVLRCLSVSYSHIQLGTQYNRSDIS